MKCVQKGKFPVIGFVKDPTGVAALYLGKKEGNGQINGSQRLRAKAIEKALLDMMKG